MGVKYVCDYCGGGCPDFIPEGVIRIKVAEVSRDLLFSQTGRTELRLRRVLETTYAAAV